MQGKPPVIYNFQCGDYLTGNFEPVEIADLKSYFDGLPKPDILTWEFLLSKVEELKLENINYHYQKIIDDMESINICYPEKMPLYLSGMTIEEIGRESKDMLNEDNGQRFCVVCGNEILPNPRLQGTNFYKAKYCKSECRNKYHKRKAQGKCKKDIASQI